jgi:hypothetical protein
MAEVYCGSEPCPLFLNSTCVFYTGESLLYIGVQNNDTLEAIIVKINQAFQNAGVGYAFTNGLIQPTPFQPVQLGGALTQNTTIGGNFTLAFTGNIQAARHITTGGTSSQFVKGDGTLDSTAYQPAANYITGLSGDATASGPGVAAMTLATVNFASGTFGNGNTIPIVTVNAKGLVTNITPVPVTIPPLPLNFIGDVVGSGFTGSNISMLLQNVNANPYNTITPLKFTVSGKGLVTSASPITASDIVNILGYYPGTSGTSGSDGTSGTSGTTGTSGTSGSSGTSGTTGTSGTSGTSGTDGSGGTSGTSGTTGTSGSSGTSGTTGTSGTSATSGTSGTSGTDGTGGTSGTSGSTGTSGTAGTSGTSATSGTSGTTGSSGTSGTSGSTGTSGSSGTTGTSGSSGTTGTSGSSGTSGTTGTSGSSGTTGTSGTDGTGGTSGSSGTTGSSGSSGTSGTSATSGSSGTSGSTGTSGSSGLSGDRFKTTSTTTYTLQAPGGTGTITVGLGLAYSVAQSIIIAYDANNHNEAEVTSYDPLTGSLSFIVFRLTGSGTYSVWSVNIDGASGGDGSSGSSGTSGTSATAGTSGTTGTSGSSGTSGTTGTSGSSGSSGTSAIDGTNGTSGTSGTTGTSGSSGTSGTTGTSGSSGTSGTSATDGTGGTSGTSGSSGTSGTTGTSGTSATSGTSGTSATSGTTGTSGTSGINGTGGTSGTSGSSATSGTSGTSGTSVAVSGNTNTIAKFTSPTTIGNSLLTDNGSTLSYNGNGVVVRDASGYIFGSYINMTDDGNPGAGTSITSFITKQGDNYYRSVSPTNAMSSIRSVASGSWGINITGNATYALNSTRLYASDPPYTYGGSSPYYMYMNYDGGSYWELKVSPATPGTVRVAYSNISGSSGSATNLYGPGGSYIQNTSTGTSYQYNYQVRENVGGYGSTNETYAPQLAFHWAGIVASSIMMESSGRIAIRNNPGTGYENFIANNVWATTALRSPIFYDENNTAYYVDPASGSRMNSITYDNLYFSGDTSYGFLGRNVYADTVNGRGSDPLELNYYDGGEVHIGAGYSKTLRAGALYTNGAVYGSIFYDSQNTAYYVDPNSTSVFSNVQAIKTYQTERYLDVPGSNDGSYRWVRFPMGWFNGGGMSAEIAISRSINDNGNSPYGGCTSRFIINSREWHSGQDNMWYFYTEHGANNAANGAYGYYIYQAGPRDLASGGYWFYMRLLSGVRYRMSVSADMNFNGNQMGGPEYDVADPGGIQRITLGSGVIGSNGNYNRLSSQYGFYGSDVRTPIYYDLDDTFYLIDPNSDSRLLRLGIGGITPDVRLSVSGDTHISNTLYMGGTAGSYNSWGSRVYMSGGDRYVNASRYEWNNVGYGSTWSFIVVGGDSYITNSSRAPIFYDSNDTFYFVDPNSTSRLSTVTAYGEYGSYRNDTQSILRSYNTSAGSPLQFYLDHNFGNVNIGNNRGVVFAGGTYWEIANSVRSPIFYDSNNTGYYLNPNGGSYFAGSLELANGYFLSNGIGGAMYMTTVSGSFGGYLRTSGHMVLDQINTGYNVYVLDGNSVGVVKNAGSQSWSAFSDRTIKTIHSLMEDNLSKLESISPIYYSFNNFADDKNRIGLIAQEVQEHFPELVEIEPMTEKLVLDYTGLIPVLLGAIKELKKEIDTLKIN